MDIAFSASFNETATRMRCTKLFGLFYEGLMPLAPWSSITVALSEDL
jgi:hypothetical protein